MEIGRPNIPVTLSEEELEEAIVDYLYQKLGKDVTIVTLKHNVGARTEDAGGMMENIVPYQEGLTLIVQEV